PIDFDFGSGILSEQNLIAGLDLRRNALAGIEHFARADRDYFAALGLFLRAIRNVEASELRFAFFEAPDDHSIVEGTNSHIFLMRSVAQPRYWNAIRHRGVQFGVGIFAASSTTRISMRPRRLSTSRPSCSRNALRQRVNESRPSSGRISTANS